MSWNRTFLLIIIILSVYSFGVIILNVYKKEYKKDAKKREYVFEKLKVPSTTTFFGIVRESTAEKTDNVNYVRGDHTPLLTLFTSWVDQEDKYVVQNRTITNWISFLPHINPVIFTDDTILGGQCRQKGWRVFPLKHTAAGGVPILKYMYIDTMHQLNSTFFGFANSDILFNDGLIKTLVTIREFLEVNRGPVLITGRRTNVDYKLPCNPSDWRNITSVSKKGELANFLSADYFITTKDYPWQQMEELIIGRMRMDNWIIQFSQLKKITVINSTPTILALHQTTETGNHEGESKKNKFYNVDIIHKIRNMTINSYQGQTDCATYVTDFTWSGQVRVVRQNQQILCNSFASSIAEKSNSNTHLIQWVLCSFVLLVNI